MNMTMKKELLKQLQETPEVVTEETQELGRFGQIWIRYMEENHPVQVMRLQLEDSFYSMALQIEAQGQELKQIIMEQLRKATVLPTDLTERTAVEGQLREQAEELTRDRILAPFN